MDLEVFDELQGRFGSNDKANASDKILLCPSVDQFDTFILVIGYALTSVGLAGNISTCASVLYFERLRRPTYILVASLSSVDICCLVIQRLARSYEDLNWTIPPEIFLSISCAFVHCSTVHVIFLSIFRLTMMKQPLKFNIRMTKMKAVLHGLVCWGIGLILGIICYVLLSQFNLINNQVGIFSFFGTFNVVLPQLSLITIHYMKVRVIRRASIDERHAAPRVRKLSNMVSIIIATNVITVLPVWIGYVTVSVVTNSYVVTKMRCYYVPLTLVLVTMHHSLNPIIFFFLSNPFRNIQCIKPSSRKAKSVYRVQQ